MFPDFNLKSFPSKRISISIDPAQNWFAFIKDIRLSGSGGQSIINLRIRSFPNHKKCRPDQRPVMVPPPRAATACSRATQSRVCAKVDTHTVHFVWGTHAHCTCQSWLQDRDLIFLGKDKSVGCHNAHSSSQVGQKSNMSTVTMVRQCISTC